MGEKDIAEKTLESYNDVFADIVNVLLFDGERLVQENDLESNDIISQIKLKDKIHEQERDVSKIWRTQEINISIIGFENQTQPDFDMPFRIISYDGASYKQQLLNKKNKQRYPVITLIIYFGEKRWNKPKRLSDCIDIPKKLMPYVNDYKINVFEIAWLDDETINKFTSDFKFVAKYFQTKRLKIDFVPSNEEIKHVDEILKLFSALTGDKNFEKIYNELDTKKGGIDMCEIVQKFISQGKAEGKEENQKETILNLLDAKAGTVEQIATWLKIPIEVVRNIAEKMPVVN